MKIQCILERNGGTEVEIDDKKYHFKPSRTDARHIAEVTDKRHIARLLAIPEAYQIPDDEDATQAPPEDVESAITPEEEKPKRGRRKQ